MSVSAEKVLSSLDQVVLLSSFTKLAIMMSLAGLDQMSPEDLRISLRSLSSTCTMQAETTAILANEILRLRKMVAS